MPLYSYLCYTTTVETSILEEVSTRLYEITYIIGIFLGLEIILISSFAKGREKLTTIFSLVVLGQILWFTTNFFTDTCRTDAQAFFWARFNPVGPIISVTCFLWFAYIFPEGGRIQAKWWKKVLIFLPSAILLILTQTPIHVISTVCDYWITTEFGPLYPVFIVFSFAYLFYWIPKVFLDKRRRADDPLMKKQISYILWGLVSYGGGLILFSVALPYTTGWEWPTLISPIMPFFFMFATLYSIVRHNLFSGKVVTAEIFSGSITIITFLNLYLSGSTREMILNGVIFVVTVWFSIMLVKSVVREVEAKEKIKELADDLARTNDELTDFNEHLEDKIRAQAHAIEESYKIEKEAREELERLDTARTHFIGATEARLREPLSLIQKILRNILALPAQATVSEEHTRDLRRTKEAANTLSSLVNKFLDISQLEVGKGILSIQPLSLPEVVRELLEEIRPEAGRRMVSFSLSLTDEAKETKVLADKEKMKKAIGCIVENALSFSPERSTVLISGAVFPHPIERTNLYQLSVSDSGPGMKQEDIRAVFGQGEKYKQGEARERKGLGISLAKEILQAHNGRIWAKSLGPNKGTTVTMELQVAKEEHETT